MLFFRYRVYDSGIREGKFAEVHLCKRGFFMRKKSKKSIETLTHSGIIAALYLALVLLFRPISFGTMQIRVAEALTILPYFTPAAISGLTIGCLLANLLGGADVLDIIFGTLATFLGAVFSYLLRRNRWLVSLPPILCNMVIIPWVLRLAYGITQAIPLMMLSVGIGEALSCGIFGQILLQALKPVRFYLWNGTKEEKDLRKPENEREEK